MATHSSDEENDDDVLQLPADTLQALADFQADKDSRAKHFEDLKAQAESNFENGSLSMDLFGEDWNASQFWYTDDTARKLAVQLLEGATSNDAIAVVSAPSVYIQLHNILQGMPKSERPKATLLEYDQRFEVFGDRFVPYNYQDPFRLPLELKGAFTRIICDPPFLSEDCQTKTALTVRYLAKSWKQEEVKLISCTGERMESVILRLYAKIGVKTTTFEPQHSKGLSNEFRCYANFECQDWKWRS